MQGATQYSASNCQSFLASSGAPRSNWEPSGSCDSTCTQQTTGVCSGDFLAKVIAGSGVKYAYCNDKWLVIGSSGEPSVFTPNLNDVPFPPGGGSNERTGMATLDTSRLDLLHYPLSITDHAGASPTQNQGVFDSTSGSGPQSYLIKGGSTVYAIPSDAGVGMGVNGQSIFPIYNNNAQYTPASASADVDPSPRSPLRPDDPHLLSLCLLTWSSPPDRRSLLQSARLTPARSTLARAEASRTGMATRSAPSACTRSPTTAPAMPPAIRPSSVSRLTAT